MKLGWIIRDCDCLIRHIVFKCCLLKFSWVVEIARKTSGVAAAWRIVKAKRMVQVLLIFGVSISISPGGSCRNLYSLEKAKHILQSDAVIPSTYHPFCFFRTAWIQWRSQSLGISGRETLRDQVEMIPVLITFLSISFCIGLISCSESPFDRVLENQKWSYDSDQCEWR